MNAIILWIFFLLFVSLPALACSSSTPQPGLIFPTDTPTLEPLPTLVATETMEPTQTIVVSTPTMVIPTETIHPTITASPQPLCTILVNVRLRTGPGVDFDQITTLYANELFVPFAYVPQGRTEGPWVKLYLFDNPKRIGWVTAGSKVIACNLDITTLPPP